MSLFSRVIQGTFNLMSVGKWYYTFIVYLFYITLITEQFTHMYFKKQELFQEQQRPILTWEVAISTDNLYNYIYRWKNFKTDVYMIYSDTH